MGRLKPFKQFVTEKTDEEEPSKESIFVGVDASKLEHVMAYLFNNAKKLSASDLTLKGVHDSLPTVKVNPQYRKQYARLVEAVKRISSLKGFGGVIPEAAKLDSELGTTPEWVKIVSPLSAKVDKTPKTDILFKGWKKKASQKDVNGFQLMSGKKGETTATLVAVLNNLPPKKQKLVNVFIEKVKKNFVDIPRKLSNGDKLEVSKVKSGAQKVPPSIKKLIMDGDAINHALQDSLKYLCEDTEIKDAIVNEALTGNYKFGQKTVASADTVLEVNQRTGMCMFVKIDGQYVSKVSKFIIPKISFKTNSSLYTSLRLDMSKSFADVVEEEYAHLFESKEMQTQLTKLNEVTEFLIGEGVQSLNENALTDFAGKVKQKAVEWFQIVKDIVLKALNKLKEVAQKIVGAFITLDEDIVDVTTEQNSIPMETHDTV